MVSLNGPPLISSCTLRDVEDFLHILWRAVVFPSVVNDFNFNASKMIGIQISGNVGEEIVPEFLQIFYNLLSS